MQPKGPYPLDFHGPFLGLDTESAPAQLGVGFATVAENVTINRTGEIRPRAPFVEWQKVLPADGELVPVGHLNGVVVGMIQVSTTALVGQVTTESFIAVLSKIIRKHGEIGSNGLFVTYTGSLGHYDLTPSADHFVISDRQPTWVMAKGWVYVVDGSTPLMKWNGSKLRPVGLPIPTMGDDQNNLNVQVFIGDINNPEQFPDTANVTYAVTFRDSTTGVESNPVYSADYDIGQIAQFVPIFTTHGDLIPSSVYGIDEVRIYRRNNTREEVPYRLVAVLDPTGEQWYDDIVVDPETSLEIISLSDRATGPFAPSRNFRPDGATIACWYKNRMWYNDPDDGNRVWFSEDDQPDHVGKSPATANSIDLPGDAEELITGMVEMAGQLIVLKKQSIWVISGGVTWHTNDLDATGAAVATVKPEWYKTKSKTGCDNSRGGNGAIVCGHPPLLYYSNAAGLFRFDGVDDRLVSDLVTSRWRALLEDVTGEAHLDDHSISFANDPEGQILYICMSMGHPAEPFSVWQSPRLILCYHWGLLRSNGVGLWTEFPREEDALYGCIASAIGVPNWLNSIDSALVPYGIRHLSPLLAVILTYTSVTQGQSRIKLIDPESTEDYPEWQWKTGDLPIRRGKRGHVHFLETHHDRVDDHTSVRVGYSLDGGDIHKLSPELRMRGDVLTRHRIAREGRTLAIRYRRGEATPYGPWKGISGFSVDSELAEPR